MLCPVADVHARHHRLHFFLALSRAEIHISEWKFNVFVHIEFINQVKALEDEADVSLSELGAVLFLQQLSGGQQQRVAIARAVVANPKLILADEPTGNLDSKNGKEVMDLLCELNREGTTIVMVTHSQKDAAMAQRTIDLFDGHIVSDVKNEL